MSWICKEQENTKRWVKKAHAMFHSSQWDSWDWLCKKTHQVMNMMNEQVKVIGSENELIMFTKCWKDYKVLIVICDNQGKAVKTVNN